MMCYYRASVFLFILVLSSAALHAQFETNYTPVQSSGTLPKDFVTLSSKKYQEAKQSLSKKEKGSSRRLKQKFLLQSNFGIDEMLLSGQVLFNDPMGIYVNKVADKVLEYDPQTRKQLRFYILKTSAVNAFATGQGIILITVGLLSKIETEAQLAYIISHEIVHYKEKHAIEQFVEADKITKGKDAYSRMTLDEKLISRCAFSKEKETESDEKGLEIFKHSGYSSATLPGMYDVLKYSYLPFGDLTFDKNFLENSTLKFPDDYYLTETKAINTEYTDDDDERSTHPNLQSRRKRTETALAGYNNTGKSDYLVGEVEFNKIRETARFEVCRIYTVKHQYEKSLYCAYLLLKKYPDNLFLKKNIAICLSGLSCYSIANNIEKVHLDKQDVEGKSQALCHLIDKLNNVKGHIPVVALAYLAKLKKQYPEDKDIDALFRTQVVLTKRYNMFSSFSKTPATSDTVFSKNQTTGESYKPGIWGKDGFTRYAFVEFMNESWFTDAFTYAESNYDDENTDEDVDIVQEMKNPKRYFDKRTYALGYKKVVVVDPYYARVNARKKEKFKFLQSESGQVDFSERIKHNAKIAKLDVEVLNSKNLKENDVEKINDLALLQDYFKDQVNHDKDVDMSFIEKERIAALAKKMNTDYFMWTGVISLTDKNKLRAGSVIIPILLPVLLPVVLPSLINNGQYTLYFALIYDVKADKIRFATFREINNRTQSDILDSHIYDVFQQIKKAKKG